MPLFSRRSLFPADGPTLPYEPGSPEGLAARWGRGVAAGAVSRVPALDHGTHELHAVGGAGEGFVVDVR